MTERTRNFDELLPVLGDMLDKQLTDEQFVQLQSILQKDPAAREFYIRHVMTHAMLEWQYSTPHLAQHTTDDKSTQEKSDPRPVSQSHLAVGSQQNSAAAPMTKTFPEAGGPSIFSFLQGIEGRIRSVPLLFAASLLIVAGAIAVLGGWLGKHPAPNRPAPLLAQETAPAANRAPTDSVKTSAVAKITAGDHCSWGDQTPIIKIGDGLLEGQSLQLVSGVAEITYDIGVRVILQSPSSFSLESPKSIRLETGKLTAEVTRVEARGFKVSTPDATFVDQGTEFGVEVAPGGSSRVHVFQGEVDLALNPKTGVNLPTQRMLANSGARLEGDVPRVTFTKDTGESFMRSMDQTQRDQHVVAYWRFEDHPVGTLLPDTQRNTLVIRATVDSSFNGNDLFTYNTLTRPVFSEDVPAEVVSQSGNLNRGCLDNTEAPYPAATRDVYTYSPFNHASPIDIQRITPSQWTIEASVKLKDLGRTQTFIGRDGAEAHVNVPPRLAFQVTVDGHLALRFQDVENRMHEAVSGDFVLQTNRWYHVAAVSDGRTLKLYASALDGRGYQLLTTEELPDDGSTALGNGGPETEWTLGRGKARNGLPGEWFKGWIDEVRISDMALEPSYFLFSENKAVLSP